MRFPRRVIHADWGTAPTKRWAAEAQLEGDRYVVSRPAVATNPVALAVQAGAPAVIGFDFPIGIPVGYARRAGVKSFVELLPQLGSGPWRDFFLPAAMPDEISLHRPFYPHRPGGAGHRHLVEGLGVESMEDLRRECERSHAGRRAAEVLFWTLGPRQVGRAAIAGWRDILIPSLGQIRLWPFDGDLEALAEDAVVVCETYPGEFYGHLGLPAAKTAHVRAAAAPALLAAAQRLGIEIEEALRLEIERGFANDDAYDAFVGLLGMINVLMRNRRPAPDLDIARLRIEGWIFGQT